MSVKKEADGRRSVFVETEAPGTPEEVWDAIATGPGVTSWFVPSEIEGRVGGTIRSTFGPGMESVAKITEWDPPRRLVAESEGWVPGAPPVATEWTVEARDGGTCVVRVVHSLFASEDDWDGQLEGTESGWPGFFAILRLYLTHFTGRYGRPHRSMAITERPAGEAWNGMIEALGLAGSASGEVWQSAGEGLPRISGVVQQLSTGEPPRALVKLDEPCAGILSSTSFSMGGKAHLLLDFFWYGDEGAEVIDRDGARWQEWLSRFTD